MYDGSFALGLLPLVLCIYLFTIIINLNSYTLYYRQDDRDTTEDAGARSLKPTVH
jgi:hypothetical protein